MRTYGAGALDEMLGLCRRHGVIAIADEVMTGFGRTGKWWACEYLQQKPDIICLSKGLTGGVMPMGLTSCTGEIFEAFLDDDKRKMFFHGHSYTGNPLGCAAALASLDLMEEPETWKAIARISGRHQQAAAELNGNPRVSAVRHLGTMLAIEIGTEDETSYFNSVRDRLYEHFISRGVLLRPLGNVVYTLPPYCISDDELDLVYQVMREGLEMT